MKAFAVWLAANLLAFGLLGGSYHLSLTDEPRKVLVVVDSSFAMKSVWHRVPKLLEEIGERRYARFALITEKGRVHDWEARPRLGRLQAYAPRNFEKLAEGAAFPEIGEASEIYFLTNAPEAELESLGAWTVLRP